MVDSALQVQVPPSLQHLRRDSRGYPLIATVALAGAGASLDSSFGSLSEQRKLLLATFDLCAVCASPFVATLFGPAVRYQVHLVGAVGREVPPMSGEAPVHRMCALYAAQVCPFVASPYRRFTDETRAGVRPAEVVLTGYARTSGVTAEPSPLQDDGSTLLFHHADVREQLRLRDSAQSRALFEDALRTDVARPLPAPDQELRHVLTGHADGAVPDDEDWADLLVAGALAAGAAFVPGLREVVGMRDWFQTDVFQRLCARVVAGPGAVVLEDLDQYLRLTGRWLTAHDAQLPEVLTGWRRHAAAPIRDALRQDAGLLPPPVEEPAGAARNSACPCGSGRKYKRCHGAPHGPL